MTQDIGSNPISNPPFIHPKKQSPAFIVIVIGEGQNIHHQFSCRITTLNDVVRYIQIPKIRSANNYRGIINTDDNEDEENSEITDAKDAILIEFQSVINDYLVKSMLEPEMKLSIQLCHDLNSHEVHHTIRSSYSPIAHFLSDIPHSIDVFKSHPGTGLRLNKGDNIGLFDWACLIDTKSGRLDSTPHKDDCIGLVFHELKLGHKNTNPGEFTGKKTDKYLKF
ncbi:hypothetical protein WICPIJ_000001 [Wickerhamomyces pijperi]|uniref:Uncharacterized protein n=1 Tax=Wickerhamomyces pijperi TaxID=599730 RepID=A0A9P8QEM4_WICPI|nr:hypothetical protein WICPIJ_000001 [Wickerhamomyces pijperi]